MIAVLDRQAQADENCSGLAQLACADVHDAVMCCHRALLQQVQQWLTSFIKNRSRIPI
jgi:hypothetical protein